MDEGQGVSFEWCRSEERARELARFFTAGLTSSYISHSELQGLRAKSPTEWSDDIGRVLEEELLARIACPDDAPPEGQTTLAASLTAEGALQGVFLVTFSRTSPNPFAVVEDMVIASSARGKGYGAMFMTWMDGECARRGIRRQFLESGLHNERAHDFFEKHGFHPVSIVMMKET